MQYPQLLIYERDGRLARMLEGTAGTHRWVLRQPREVEKCLLLLRRGGPAIVVVKMDSDLEPAFSLVGQVTWRFPDVARIVVGDMESPVLGELAWDLGASYVLLPPQPRELLLTVVVNLMANLRNPHGLA
jgi:hypothetical protein